MLRKCRKTKANTENQNKDFYSYFQSLNSAEKEHIKRIHIHLHTRTTTAKNTVKYLMIITNNSDKINY